MASPTLQRRQVMYSGRVQGVGFRYTTRSIARGYQVTGYVRNLPDGRVELVAEGTSDELNRFLSDVAAKMAEQIRSADSFRLTPDIPFTPDIPRIPTQSAVESSAMGRSQMDEFAEFTIRY